MASRFVWAPAAALLCAAAMTPAYAHEPHRAPPGYKLVFADEFDGKKIDTRKWRFDTHRNAQGWYNDELQYYAANRRENSRIENGKLVIEARAERLAKDRFRDWGGQDYTSARMITKAPHAWTYGYYEIRARIPCGRGTWPAVWMLPSDPKADWPGAGEIDIMEHVGFDPGVVHQTIHTTANNHVIGTQIGKQITIPDVCTAMHRYQLWWTRDAIEMGVDDKKIFRLDRVPNDRARWPFDKPMNIILNVAVGGGWGGQKGIDPAAFPAVMEVDYVRVYQPAR